MEVNKNSCLYAVVRFMPFVETQEFANVGVVLFSEKHSFFGYRLLTSRYRRISQFFSALSVPVFRSTMREQKKELDRIKNVLCGSFREGKGRAGDQALAETIFDELIRPRESIIRFSAPGLVLSESPEDTLDQLFRQYVAPDFVSSETGDAALVQKVRSLLLEHNLKRRFREETVTDGDYKVRFPFVEVQERRPIKIIKPLNLSHDSPTNILEAGSRWRFRIEQLQRRKVLPGRVLFAHASPATSSKRGLAAEEAVKMIEETGVSVTSMGEAGRIVEFAGAV